MTDLQRLLQEWLFCLVQFQLLSISPGLVLYATCDDGSPTIAARLVILFGSIVAVINFPLPLPLGTPPRNFLSSWCFLPHFHAHVHRRGQFPIPRTDLDINQENRFILQQDEIIYFCTSKDTLTLNFDKPGGIDCLRNWNDLLTVLKILGNHVGWMVSFGIFQWKWIGCLQEDQNRAFYWVKLDATYTQDATYMSNAKWPYKRD